MVNAKTAAPWYNLARKRQEEQNGNVTADLTNTDRQKLTGNFDRLKVSDETIANNHKSDDTSSPKVRYLLDFTLNRFCRWLRILGLDAALETEEEEKERTRDGKM